MHNPFTIPYCQMTALDSLAVGIPLVVILVFILSFFNRK